MTLYLSYDGLTDPLGQSQILPYLFGLCDQGFVINIISFEKKDRFEKHKALIQSLIEKKPNISWHPLTYHRKPPLLSTFYDLWKLKKVASKIIRNQNIKLIHCRSYPTSIIGMRLKKKFNTKFIFDMRGLYIDERFDGEIWNKKNKIWRWLYPKLKNLERNMINSADIIVSLTEEGKREILSWPKIEEANIQVTPCAVDLQHFDHPYSKDTSNLNIAYLGSLGTWYLLEEMLDFFNRLTIQRPNAIFHFITTDDPEKIISCAKAKNISLDKLKIYPSTREELPAKLAIMDLSIFFIKPSYSKKASSPTKLGELLSMGIPVICNRNVGDLNNQSELNSDYIIAIDMEQKEYDRIVLKIDDLLETRAKKHVLIRAVGKKYFSLEAGVEKYTQIYRELLPRK